MPKEQKPEQDRGGSQSKYSPLDDKAIVKNPTSDAYGHDQANQAEQARQASK